MADRGRSRNFLQKGVGGPTTYSEQCVLQINEIFSGGGGGGPDSTWICPWQLSSVNICKTECSIQGLRFEECHHAVHVGSLSACIDTAMTARVIVLCMHVMTTG